MPKAVSGRMIGAARSDSPDQVPVEFSGELFYENDVTANITAPSSPPISNGLTCAARTALRVDDFVVPFFGSEMIL